MQTKQRIIQLLNDRQRAFDDALSYITSGDIEKYRAASNLLDKIDAMIYLISKTPPTITSTLPNNFKTNPYHGKTNIILTDSKGKPLTAIPERKKPNGPTK
jgi:hypothetical protein